MIRINLLPIKETELATRRRQQLSVLALAVSLMALLMVVMYAWERRSLSRLESEGGELKAEIAKYDEQAREARDLDRKKKELVAKLAVIRDLDRKRVGPARILSDLSVATPEKLWIEEFSESQGVANIVGWALDNQTVAAFMRQLSASPYFFKVDLTEATQPDRPVEQGRAFVSEGGTIRFKRFVIKASLDYFGRGGKPPETQGQPAPGAPAQPGKSET